MSVWLRNLVEATKSGMKDKNLMEEVIIMQSFKALSQTAFV